MTFIENWNSLPLEYRKKIKYLFDGHFNYFVQNGYVVAWNLGSHVIYPYVYLN